MAYRIDVSKMDAPKIDANGFLIAKAKFTRTGVFPYLNYDGTTTWELRHPEDVFDEKSLATAESQVITNDHPPFLLYSDNCKEHSVGFTGDKIDVTESKYIGGSIKIFDEKAINDVVQGGKKELSEGYRCDVVDEIGNYDGIAYTKRQKNIRYNHLSLVWEGRAGPDVSIKTDGADKDFAVMKVDSKNKSCKADQPKVQLSDDYQKLLEDKNVPAKIKIDSVEFEVSETVAQAVQLKLDAHEATKADLLASKQELSKAQANVDVLKSDSAKKDEQIESLKSQLSDDAILARSDELMKVKEFAKEILGEDKKDSIDELKKAVVSKQTGIDCSKKDSTYINAAFEALLSSYKPAEKSDALADGIASSVNHNDSSFEAKKKAHYDALNSRWKSKK